MKSLSKNKTEILMLLKKNESLTFNELIVHFTISEPALRKHIHQLVQQKYVERKAHKQKIGRPFYTYELTKEGHQFFEQQNERLPLEILEDLEVLYGKDAVCKLLERRMVREKSSYENSCHSNNVEENIKVIIQIQNENGYMAEMYKRENGEMEVLNYHCPVYQLAHEYGQICSNEKVMYEQLFPDRTIQMDSNIVKGDHVCKWIIAPKADK